MHAQGMVMMCSCSERTPDGAPPPHAALLAYGQLRVGGWVAALVKGQPGQARAGPPNRTGSCSAMHTSLR